MRRPSKLRRKNTTIAPRRSRRYHLVDDDAAIFETELPDWLVGAY
jgi:hypothetical protein